MNITNHKKENITNKALLDTLMQAISSIKEEVNTSIKEAKEEIKSENQKLIQKIEEHNVQMKKLTTDPTKEEKKNYNGQIQQEVQEAKDLKECKKTSISGDNAETYRNRKGYFSLNVQAVCDSDYKVTDIVARWPGSSHDSHIFRKSAIKVRFETGEFGDAILLGDSGYPLTNYLMTPNRISTPPSGELCNHSHVATRTIIEGIKFSIVLCKNEVDKSRNSEYMNVLVVACLTKLCNNLVCSGLARLLQSIHILKCHHPMLVTLFPDSDEEYLPEKDTNIKRHNLKKCFVTINSDDSETHENISLPQPSTSAVTRLAASLPSLAIPNVKRPFEYFENISPGDEVVHEIQPGAATYTPQIGKKEIAANILKIGGDRGQKVFSDFYSITLKDLQDSYLYGLIQRHKIEKDHAQEKGKPNSHHFLTWFG
ncbi:hypothetical protein NQ317_002962 [Molorchus minor]|uniref:DDE Tnp4 domain-containing protein n=1 Tax=Molorchus minor TaxID=1323400 RepID=A0ABQ9J288_9CUCU|nr:hypothetical protein NQ317_002962 [Molorchus minor]